MFNFLRPYLKICLSYQAENNFIYYVNKMNRIQDFGYIS